MKNPMTRTADALLFQEHATLPGEILLCRDALLDMTDYAGVGGDVDAILGMFRVDDARGFHAAMVVGRTVFTGRAIDTYLRARYAGDASGIDCFHSNVLASFNNGISDATGSACLCLRLDGDDSLWRAFRADENDVLPTLGEIYMRNGYDAQGHPRAMHLAESVN